MAIGFPPELAPPAGQEVQPTPAAAPFPATFYRGQTPVLGQPVRVGLVGETQAPEAGPPAGAPGAAQPPTPTPGPWGTVSRQAAERLGRRAETGMTLGALAPQLIRFGLSVGAGSDPSALTRSLLGQAGWTAAEMQRGLETLGPMTPWELRHLTAQDLANVRDFLQWGLEVPEYGYPGAAGPPTATGPAATLSGVGGAAASLGAGLLGPALRALGVEPHLASAAGTAAQMAAAALTGSPYGFIAAPVILGITSILSRPGRYARHRRDAAAGIRRLVPYVFGAVLSSQTPEQLAQAVAPFDVFRVRLDVPGGPETATFGGGYEMGASLWPEINPRLQETIRQQQALIALAAQGVPEAQAALEERARLGLELFGQVEPGARYDLIRPELAAVLGKPPEQVTMKEMVDYVLFPWRFQVPEPPAEPIPMP